MLGGALAQTGGRPGLAGQRDASGVLNDEALWRSDASMPATSTPATSPLAVRRSGLLTEMRRLAAKMESVRPPKVVVSELDAIRARRAGRLTGAQDREHPRHG